MSEQRTARRVEHASSTGHEMAAADWLDLHFAACRPEYEAMARAAGFQPGWRVLDAGCGGGAFLPVLAELVGPSGRLAALDLAPENIAQVEARLATRPLACPVQARVGNIAALPYLDDYFDGVWCAATLMYLPDDALLPVLAELRRVVRPGGLIAVKDWENDAQHLPTHTPNLHTHLIEVWGAPGALRGLRLRAWLRRAGLEDVQQTTMLVERYAPLAGPERAWLTASIAAWSEAATRHDLPEAERAEWAELGADPDRLLDDPDFYYREGHVLAIGRVPDRG